MLCLMLVLGTEDRYRLCLRLVLLYGGHEGVESMAGTGAERASLLVSRTGTGT
jgi:hypothetical protein